MGLDTMVFANAQTLSARFPGCEIEMEDPEIGQYRVHAAEVEALLSMSLVCDYWIGNISHVAMLRDQARDIVGPDSIVMSRVLYSGSHAGDHIPMELNQDLLEELDRCLTSPEHWLRLFALNMSGVVRVSEAEGNPVCF